MLPVLVEGWQYECCGEPPAVGQHVSWRLRLHLETWAPAAVDLAVDVEEVPPGVLEQWLGLGNQVGAAPVLLRRGGLTAYLPDGRVLEDGRVRGVLHEDHHVDVPLGVPATTGTIGRVRLVSREHRSHRRQQWGPVEGTEQLVDVDAAPASLPYDLPPEGALVVRQISQALVDLEVDPA